MTSNRLFMAVALSASLLAGAAHAMGKTEPRFTRVLIDQLEARHLDAGTQFAWDASVWHGGDLNKLYLVSEGERLNGDTGHLETRAAWSHAFAPFWDWQIGVRRDWQPDQPNRDWASVGLQGLAPYFFATDINLFIGEGGRTNLRLNTEYDLLFTQRLVLTPALEANLHGKEDKELGIGAGLASLEAGLRLRYEINRRFAPYLGIHWHKQFGDTAAFTRQRGGGVEETSLVVGLRVWY